MYAADGVSPTTDATATMSADDMFMTGKIAMLDTTAKIFARAGELVSLGLSVPEVTKIFLRLAELGIDIPTDVYTVGYARDTILRALGRKGGEADA